MNCDILINESTTTGPIDNKILIEMLESNDYPKQTTAARRIWTDWNQIENKKNLNVVSPILLDLLKKSDDQGREVWHFMISLGCLQNLEAIPIILDKLENSESVNIRGFAAEALSRYSLEQVSDNVLEGLWACIENEENELVVIVNSIRALKNYYANTRNDDIANRLIEAIDFHENPIIKNTIVEALGTIGSIEATPHLIHFMIMRRTELEKSIAADALDMIAYSNGLKDRKELMDKYGFTKD